MRLEESLFFFALAFYTVAIVTSRVRSRLLRWMVVLFGAGLLCDLSGTIFLCFWSASGWQWTAHSISGMAALLIMALHFAWGIVAWRNSDNKQDQFHRYSLWAWLLWVFAFVSGIPTSFTYQAVSALGIVVLAIVFGALYCAGFIWYCSHGYGGYDCKQYGA